MQAHSVSWRWKCLIYIGGILLLNVGGAVYYIYYLSENGYLPSPFIYDKSDTFMDFFNVLYWAYDDGRYTDWGSVYPPLGFLILRLVNFLMMGGGYGDPAIMRENSLPVVLGICFIYLAIPIFLLKIRYWQDFSGIEKTLIYFAIIFSSPMLFTLERGNLIIIAPLFLAFTLSKIGVARSVFVALLINIKPYFVLLAIYYITRKNWKGLASTIIFSGFIFAISGLALDKNFLYFFANIFDFSQEEGIFSIREVMALPSSISAFSYVLKHPDGATFASGFLNPDLLPYLVGIIEAAKWSVLIISMSVLFTKSWLMRDAEILCLLIVAISNLGIWVGGYTFIFYVALIPVIFTLRARWAYIGLLLLIALPLDVIPLVDEFIGKQYSYFADAYVQTQWTLGLGSVLRPIANFLLLLLLSSEFTLRKKMNEKQNDAKAKISWPKGVAMGRN